LRLIEPKKLSQFTQKLCYEIRLLNAPIDLNAVKDWVAKAYSTLFHGSLDLVTATGSNKNMRNIEKAVLENANRIAAALKAEKEEISRSAAESKH
jgi:hypothetical protein